VSAITNEWVRWVNSGCCQGDAQESLHPNAWGEQAVGRCVSSCGPRRPAAGPAATRRAAAAARRTCSRSR